MNAISQQIIKVTKFDVCDACTGRPLITEDAMTIAMMNGFDSIENMCHKFGGQTLIVMDGIIHAPTTDDVSNWE